MCLDEDISKAFLLALHYLDSLTDKYFLYKSERDKWFPMSVNAFQIQKINGVQK